MFLGETIFLSLFLFKNKEFKEFYLFSKLNDLLSFEKVYLVSYLLLLRSFIYELNYLDI